MSGDLVWAMAVLLIAVPIGLALCQHWANSRAPGVVVLDQAENALLEKTEPAVVAPAQPEPAKPD